MWFGLAKIALQTGAKVYANKQKQKEGKRETEIEVAVAVIDLFFFSFFLATHSPGI